jgi:hypothetical protein
LQLCRFQFHFAIAAGWLVLCSCSCSSNLYQSEPLLFDLITHCLSTYSTKWRKLFNLPLMVLEL